jgi:hypothetical protein
MATDHGILLPAGARYSEQQAPDQSGKYEKSVPMPPVTFRRFPEWESSEGYRRNKGKPGGTAGRPRPGMSNIFIIFDIPERGFIIVTANLQILCEYTNKYGT